VKRTTDRIVLNAADLDIQRASLSGVSAAPRIVLDAGQQTAAFVFPAKLTPAKVRSRALRVIAAVGCGTSMEIATLPVKVRAPASGVMATA
jgi:hypothetical protein